MDMEDTRIYNNFVRELTEWTQEGALPESGSQDIAFYLRLQQDRLKKRDVRVDYSFQEIKGKKKNEFLVGWTAKDQRHTLKMAAADFSREVRCYRDHKCLYKEKKDTLFYQVITYLNDDCMQEEELYCCPNCSAISSVKSLLEGCPYCHTKFKITDFFPKVTDFYYSDYEVNYSMLRGSKMLGPLLVAPMMLIGMLRAPSFGAAVQTLLFGLFIIPFSSFLGYFGFALLFLLFCIPYGITRIPKYRGRDSARYRLTALFRGYNPDFSYDYFICKMVSLLKTIVFADDRSNLAVCEGNVDENAFCDVIDTTYQGALTLNDCQVEGKYCYLDINLYMSNLYDSGRSIQKKNEIYRMKVCKNITKPEDYGFSIRRIQCGGCGGSFDATRIKYCPYCGREYDLKEDDWVVLDLRIK